MMIQEFIAEKFKDVNTIIKTAEELKSAGYRIFSDTGSLRHFTYGNDPEPWVKDGKLMMTEGRLNYFDAAVQLYQEKLVALHLNGLQLVFFNGESNTTRC